MTNRRYFMEVNGVQSEMLPVRSGVPKGSILGPFLFIVYVNDIQSLSSFSFVYIYADYTRLIKSIYSLEVCSHLQEDLDALYSWCQHWKLTMNLSKYCVLHTSCSCSFPPSSYTVGGKTIGRVSQQKDLDVLVNSNLPWSAHIVEYVARHIIDSTAILITSPINVKKHLSIAGVINLLTILKSGILT